MSVTQATAVCREHWFECDAVQTLSRGRINDTYFLRRRTDAKAFVFQRLNSVVFTDSLRSMQQTQRISAHIQTRHAGWAPPLQATNSGAYFVQRDAAELWRMWQFVDGSVALDELKTPGQLRAAGQAFGHTQELLRDLPGERLVDPIPGLFELDQHLATLDDEVAHLERALSDQEVQAVTVARQLAPIAAGLGGRESYVHGDCKPANLLFEATADAGESIRVKAVVDFDTTMFGHWAWDFGDLVRSAACTESGFQLERVAALIDGYFAGSPRRRHESVELFALAPRYVAGCLGVRYLVDHLQGDRQFKIRQPGDNLRRARERFGLMQEITQAGGALEQLVKQSLRS